MRLPFTHEAFLDVFGRYNTSLWPLVAALWVATAVIVLHWLRTGRLDGRLAFGLLAVHWGWSAIAYHWFFFRSINPAAAVLAAFFVLQAGLFTRVAISACNAVIADFSLRGVMGGALVLYGLSYPFISLASGLKYPRLPLFAVPCPTALITAGVLVASSGVPRFVSTVPILWSVVGASAAFVLGIRADLALVAAGAVLALDSVSPSALGTRRRS
jgi:hypothetical protein